MFQDFYSIIPGLRFEIISEYFGSKADLMARMVYIQSSMFNSSADYSFIKSFSWNTVKSLSMWSFADSTIFSSLNGFSSSFFVSDNSYTELYFATGFSFFYNFVLNCINFIVSIFISIGVWVFYSNPVHLAVLWKGFLLLLTCSLLVLTIFLFLFGEPYNMLVSLVTFVILMSIILIKNHSEYFGVVLCLVYLGAIVVLFMILNMLLTLVNLKSTSNFSAQTWYSFIGSIVVLFTIAKMFFSTIFADVVCLEKHINNICAEALGNSVSDLQRDLNLYKNLFEYTESYMLILVTIILLVAMIGAVVIVQYRQRQD